MKFAILITTKNRLQDLTYTLQKISHLLVNPNVECIVCDDGSIDGTFEYITSTYPKVTIFRNNVSKGLIYSRNRLLAKTTSTYSISIDDDLHFISENPLEEIENYFIQNPKCGVIGFRIFWSLQPPKSTQTLQTSTRVKGFAGGAHVWKMEAWRSIPNYPDWFIFYGEEDFAAYQLFTKQIEIHYLPSVLVHHRVDLLSRKKNADYQLRQRRSFRSGWYLYFLFYPLQIIPKMLLYTLWMQVKNKTFKGDFKATLGIIQALFDVVINLPKLLKQSNRLSLSQFKAYEQLEPTKLYWKPEDEK